MTELNKIKLNIFLMILSMATMLCGVIVQGYALVTDHYHLGHLGTSMVIFALWLRIVIKEK